MLILLVTLLPACSDEAAGTDSVSSDGDIDNPDGISEDDHFPYGDAADGDQPDGDLPDGGEPDSPTATITNFKINRNPLNVLSYFAEWETDTAVKTWLEVYCGQVYHEIIQGDVARTKHNVFVMGLIESTECTFTAWAGSNSASDSRAVGPLPETLPGFQLRLIDEERMQAGWTIMNLSNKHDDIPFAVAAVDEMGRIRWYYQVNTADPGTDNDVSVVPEGVLIGDSYNQIDSQIVAWHGETVWHADFPVHHHIAPYQGDQLIYLWRKRACQGDDWTDYQDILTDTINIWDRSENKIVWTWIFCKHYTPNPIFQDWAHVNAVAIFEGENAMLVSARHQNSLFKVDMEDGHVIWRLGQAGDFDMSQKAVFWQQHAPEIQENGNILLFDNGHEEYRAYSRTVEISYNEETMETEMVWEHVPDPPFFSSMWGDADRLPNGNTLGTYGMRSTTVRSRLMESTHDMPAETVWWLELDLKWGVYRADRIIDPPMGYVLEAD